MYHTSDWSDTYDQNAQYVRAQNPHGLDVPMLMTELLPTAEYADDMLPFCSDWSSATFRISNMRRGLMRLGGVKLNMGKLKFMLIRRPQKFRITSKQIEDYSRKRTDWHECQFCKRREPCKSSMMQHQRYCKHPSRDPVDLSASGKPMKYCVKKIEDCAGPPGNRWYLVRWSHPYDPSPGVMPGDKGYVHWSPRAQDGPGYPSSWEHECNVGDGSKRAIVAHFASIHKPGFGESKACEDPNLHRCGFCNERFEEACELREHVKNLCDSKPSLRSGSKAWAATKRNIVNSGSGKDLQKARLLGGDESDGVKIGGQEHEYCLDGEILGSILSGDNDCLPAINQRMAIGRDAFNALHRVFKRKTLADAPAGAGSHGRRVALTGLNICTLLTRQDMQ